jgi:hypothetical protein
MSIEALYPSRRHPQNNNPLLRREHRRQRVIAALALGFCVVSMAALRISPNEAAAEARLPIAPKIAIVAVPAHRHIRVIPLDNIPPEQRGGVFADQN